MTADQYESGARCSVVDETTGTLPWQVTYCDADRARLHPEIGAGIAVCLAHELDSRVHIVSYRGTTRVIIPQEEEATG